MDKVSDPLQPRTTRTGDQAIASAVDAMVDASQRLGTPQVPGPVLRATPAPAPAADNIPRSSWPVQPAETAPRLSRCAMDEDASTDEEEGRGADQEVDESGRRESNPRSQLGKLPGHDAHGLR
jgi:hypothetical protein